MSFLWYSKSNHQHNTYYMLCLWYENMLDDKQIVYCRISGDRVYFRMVNHKMIKHLCDMYDIELQTDTITKRIYIDVKYLYIFLNAMSRSDKHVLFLA